MGGTASTDAGGSPPASDAQASPQSASQCPVDHSKMSKEQLAGFMHPFSSRNKSPPAEEQSTGQADPQESGCPVDHKNMSKSQLEAFEKGAKANAHKVSPPQPTKPAKTTKQTSKAPPEGAAYDVYGQEINTSNMMPATPNQLPSPGQSAPLSTAREASTIPKSGAGDDATWTYPSAQMFYNALQRKGKAGDVSEDDMPSVIAVHNSMNERTWSDVMAWEKRFHCDECPAPKLKRFMGRPHDLSPTARFRMWFRGYTAPFDRHDWIVDRCGSADVRYVIDYYSRDDEADPIEIHVRPALDSPAAVWDRIRASVLPDAVDEPTPPRPQPAPAVAQDEVPAEEYESLRTLTPAGVQSVSDTVREKCAALGDGFRKCREAGGDCDAQNVSLNYCMARQICTPTADRFMHTLENGGDETTAYANMTACLDRFHIMARRVMMHAAGITAQGPEFPAHGGDAAQEQS